MIFYAIDKGLAVCATMACAILLANIGSAQTTLSLGDGYIEVERGDNFSVPVQVEDVDDLAGFEIDLSWDTDAFELNRITRDTYLGNPDSTDNTFWMTIRDAQDPMGWDHVAEIIDEANLTGSLINVVWAHVGQGSVSGNGTLFTLRFKVRDSAPYDYYQVDILEETLLSDSGQVGRALDPQLMGFGAEDLGVQVVPPCDDFAVPPHLDFGYVSVGESATLFIKVDSTCQDVVGVDVQSSEAQFAAGGAVLAATGYPGFLPVTFTAGAVGPQNANIVFSAGDNEQTVTATGHGIDPATNHIILGSVPVLEPHTGIQSVDLDVVLRSDILARFVRFDLEFPPNLVVDDPTVVKNPTRVPGSVQQVNGSDKLTVSALDFAGGDAVLAGDGTIFTITVAVDTSLPGVHALTFTNLDSTPGLALAAALGQLIVGNTAACTFDVDDTGDVTFEDIVYIFRKTILGAPVHQIVPTTWDEPNISVEDIKNFIACLEGTMLLDIDEQDGITFEDLVYLYRRGPLDALENQVVPDGWEIPAVGTTRLTENIDRSLP